MKTDRLLPFLVERAPLWVAAKLTAYCLLPTAYCLLIPAYCLLFLVPLHSTRAEEKEYAIRVIAGDIDNPCGVAIQPGTGHVFVSAHKSIFRIVPQSKTKSIEIDGFATDVYGDGPKYDISALGLAFLDSTTLVVGGGDRAEGSELVYFYTVGDAPLSKDEVIKSSAAKFTSGPIKPSKDSEKGEEDLFAIAINRSEIFVTCNGDDTRGWISKITVTGGKPGPLVPFIKSKAATGVDAPVGAVISPEGKLVVCQLGEINLPGDSLLTFYNPATGKLKKCLPTGLNDLLAIAYSKTDNLYGLDFSWMAPEKGGLFLLEPGESSVKAIKIVGFDKPTAMSFAQDGTGTLYVCLLGTAEETDSGLKKKFPGQLLAVDGLQ